ncbi:uncharacterized protein N7458_005804 [Penicillium daleae]|uniref:Uncharacterized protein n=1 Tax=Penicillium daleae TaxID=63821 RepID=A0AAD6C8W1_9EURO|nr:uncharacterized protein N7458_005804 [Penicillium daleae]KAJ5454848.1 hypothetical protein N7458_005804 [Penicillium daleae]
MAGVQLWESGGHATPPNYPESALARTGPAMKQAFLEKKKIYRGFKYPAWCHSDLLFWNVDLSACRHLKSDGN